MFPDCREHRFNLSCVCSKRDPLALKGANGKISDGLADAGSVTAAAQVHILIS